MVSHRPSEGLSAADAGLAVNPNDAVLLLGRAAAENALGQYAQAKDDMERAIRLSPRDPIVGAFHVTLGIAEIGLGHRDAAIDEMHKTLDLGVRSSWVYTNLAAAYALAGRMDEARASVAEARRLDPELTVKGIIEHTWHNSPMLDGLRKAGLPEE